MERAAGEQGQKTQKTLPVAGWTIEATAQEGVAIDLRVVTAEETGTKERTVGSEMGRENQGAAAIFAEAVMERKKPYFGAQPFLDPKKGISYRIRGLGTGKMTAIYQHKDWWLRPAFVQECKALPARTQLILLERDGVYTAILAVCEAECRSDMEGWEDGLLVTMASNQQGRESLAGLSLAMAWGSNPYWCCERAAEYALKLLGHPEMLRENRKFPEVLESFGWCSWDAFYHQVKEAGVLEKVRELREKKVPVKWVLIDDGWMDADYEKQVLLGLDADREKFPEGLGACVQKLKREYGIANVGVWHAVMGYWNGLQAGSEADRAMARGSLTLPDGRIISAAEAGAAFCFYDTWHGYLKQKCGIDFVKVDGQSAISLFYSGRESYGKASGEIQKGLGASAALHFENQIINCMGMAPEDLWHRPSSAVSRSSDDFMPEVKHGFREHAVQNSFNTLLQGQFFWGDWDMFWSSHEENRQNSLLRAVSGGPVYVSDAVGKTDPRFILPLVLADGRLIRCDSVGMPVLDCLFEDPVRSKKAFQIWNRKGSSYVVAALNIQEENVPCEGEIRLAQIPDIPEGSYIVYAWKEKKAWELGADGAIPFSLEANDGELFLLVPRESGATLLGLTDKYIGTACVEEIRREPGKVTALLKQGGEIGLWCEETVEKIVCEGKEVPFRLKGALCLAQIESDTPVMAEVYISEGRSECQ